MISFNPAVFFPGFGSPHQTPHFYMPYLKKLDCFSDIYMFFDEDKWINHNISNITLAAAVYIEQNLPPNTPINLIGYSMGGLQTLEFATIFQNINDIKGILTISSPLYGLYPYTKLLSKIPAIQHMQQDSQYLKDLHKEFNKIHKHIYPNVRHLYSHLDEFIPQKNSMLYLNEQNSFRIPMSTHLTIMFRNLTVDHTQGLFTNPQYKPKESPKIHVIKI